MLAQFKNQAIPHGTLEKLSEKWSKKSKAVETKLSGSDLQISNYILKVLDDLALFVSMFKTFLYLYLPAR